jgi:hypothetical protein
MKRKEIHLYIIDESGNKLKIHFLIIKEKIWEKTLYQSDRMEKIN